MSNEPGPDPQDANSEEYQIPGMPGAPAPLPTEAITVELTGHMAFKLFSASHRRGQTSEEFVRDLIGQICQDEPEPPPQGARLDLPERGTAPNPMDMLESFMPDMGKYLRLMQAALGSFSCPECTQRVSEKAALEGTCAQCNYEFGT